jgi:hypothetical protein
MSKMTRPRRARAGLRAGKWRALASGILNVLNLATCQLNNVYHSNTGYDQTNGTTWPQRRARVHRTRQHGGSYSVLG